MKESEKKAVVVLGALGLAAGAGYLLLKKKEELAFKIEKVEVI